MAAEPSKDEKATVSERRVSHMSIEDPLSPASNSSDSIYEEEEEEYEHDYRENRLVHHLSRTVSTNSVGNVVPTLELQRTWTSRTSGTLTDPAYEIDFEDEEQGNPQNWPLWYKGIILAVMSYSTTAVVLFSTSYTSAIPGMIDTFGISNSEGILGVTTYLLGMGLYSLDQFRYIKAYSLMYGSCWLCDPCAFIRNVWKTANLCGSSRWLRCVRNSMRCGAEYRYDTCCTILWGVLCCRHDLKCSGNGQ